jgi:hypothetical protein
MLDQTIEITEVGTDRMYRKVAFTLEMKSEIVTQLLDLMTHESSVRKPVISHPRPHEHAREILPVTYRTKLKTTLPAMTIRIC